MMALLSLVIVLPGTARGLAQDDDAAARADAAAKVTAAYLLNFARLVTLPPDAFHDEADQKAPLEFVVLGDDTPGVADVLEAIVAGKTVVNRSVVVRRVAYPNMVSGPRLDESLRVLFEQLEKAHVLYIDSSLRDEVRHILERLHGDDMLTVSNCEGFAANGGMLGLVKNGERIVFEANTDAIAASRVTVSSQILRLARIVKTRDA